MSFAIRIKSNSLSRGGVIWRESNENTGQYDERVLASFLFITKSGICGALQIRPPAVPSLTHSAAPVDRGGWSYQFIYDSSIEK